jgi:hypothetical protein
MVPLMYVGTPEFMYSAAARSVLSAVVHMIETGKLYTSDEVNLTASYHITA